MMLRELTKESTDTSYHSSLTGKSKDIFKDSNLDDSSNIDKVDITETRKRLHEAGDDINAAVAVESDADLRKKTKPSLEEGGDYN